MLSGFGEAGTSVPDEPTNDPQRRRQWTCWCGAHRPQMTSPNSNSSPNLIILEFELERDPFNPLYPPSTEEGSVASGISSPSDASASTGGSTGASDSASSGRTLVSTASGDTSDQVQSTPEGSTPSLNLSSERQTPLSASNTANSASPTPSEEERNHERMVTGSTSFSTGLGADGGARTREEWLPNPADILESTTSRAKPLLALERLRRSRRVAPEPISSAASVSSGGGGAARLTGNTRRPGARNRRGGGGAVGMMDVFAVMGQINEQLGAAPDLETFLKVVVGVIKDLTQFHRVLAYQFDESWNGKVVAELVDWTQTHDLYHGLHFPASDIPAQVCFVFFVANNGC